MCVVASLVSSEVCVQFSANVAADSTPQVCALDMD